MVHICDWEGEERVVDSSCMSCEGWKFAHPVTEKVWLATFALSSVRSPSLMSRERTHIPM